METSNHAFSNPVALAGGAGISGAGTVGVGERNGVIGGAVAY